MIFKFFTTKWSESRKGRTPLPPLKQKDAQPRQQDIESLRQIFKDAVERLKEQMTADYFDNPRRKPFPEQTEEFEARTIATLLDICGGEQVLAAELLGMSLDSLRDRLKRHGLPL